MNQLNQIQEQEVPAREFNMYGGVNTKLALSFREFANAIIQYEVKNIQNAANIGWQYKPLPVKININTPGGSVTDGNAIISTIRDLQSYGIEVNCHCEGCVASMGIFLTMVCDNRTADNLTEFMYHNMIVYNWDNIERTEDLLKHNKRIGKMLTDELIKRTNFTQEIIDKYKKDDFWFTYSEAVELGLITYDLFKEEELTEDDLAIHSIQDMNKEELKNYIVRTKEVFENKLKAELDKDKPDLFLVNSFENTLYSCDTSLTYVKGIEDCSEIEDMFALTIFDLINVAMLEGDSIEK